MNSNQGGASGSGADSEGKRLRPQPPILDLKPTGVSVEPMSPAAGEPGPPPDREAPPAAAAERAGVASPDELASEPEPQTSAADTAPIGAAAPDRMPSSQSKDGPSSPPPQHARRGGLAGVMLGAAAAAAMATVAVLVLTWALGLEIGRDKRVDATTAQVTALQTRTNELAARPVVDPRVEQLVAQMTAVEQALQQVRALDARLTQAEAALARPVAAAADPDVSPRIAALDEAMKALGAAVADLRQRVDATTSASQAGSASAQQASVAIEALGKRIEALEATARTLQSAATQSNAPDRDRQARLGVAAMALRPAVESGAPFTAELTAVKALVPDPARLAALEPFAASGVPSVAALTHELSAQIAAARPKPGAAAAESAGFLQWVQNGFARIVRIRPAGAPDATDSDGALARVEAQAARGALTEALAEAAKLPAAERAAVAPWMQRAQGRVAALAAAQGLARDSLAALAAAGGQPASQ